MRIDDELPDNAYYQSYLYKAGIRFDINIIDTICKKKISWSFILIFSLLVFLLFSVSHINSLFDIKAITIIICLLYIAYYLMRWAYCINIRQKLVQDVNPIIVEAYATVILDMQKPLIPFLALKRNKKAVVLYKECGTLKPRFFTSAIKPCSFVGFFPEQMARVFIDRKRPSIYCIDDSTALSTVSKKNKIFERKNVVNIQQNKSVD